MNDYYKVEHLRCGHCGNSLPVMGQYVTFQCGTCNRYWIITPRGLEPMTVMRAELPEGYEGDPALLPFWVIEVDRKQLRDYIESTFAESQELTRTLVTTKFENDFSVLDRVIGDFSGEDPAIKNSQMLGAISHARNAPFSSELNHLLDRIDKMNGFNIFVPAFCAANTFSYIKVGRLLTREQPSFRIARSSQPGRPVMCSVQAAEAAVLMDYIFIATLPDSIQEKGEFLNDIHLEAASEPKLIEFPFEKKGSSLKSLFGGFEISAQTILDTL